MKYKVGDRVRIKPLEEFLLCSGRNKKGLMDKYAGTVMTIGAVYDDYYKMVEDQGEGFNDGWTWFDHFIEGLDTSISKPLLIKLLMKG